MIINNTNIANVIKMMKNAIKKYNPKKNLSCKNYNIIFNIYIYIFRIKFIFINKLT